MALEVLPTDAALELKYYAEKHSLRCAKIRSRRHKRNEADADFSQAEKHLASFKEKCEGLLSDKSCHAIEMMLEYAGRHASNSSNTSMRRIRSGFRSYADTDEREVEEHYQDIIKKGEISENLARNLKEMGWSAARFASYSIFRYKEETERQKANLDSSFAKIHGEVDVAQILSQRPKPEEPIKLVNNVPLEIFPPHAADELKAYAERQSLHSAKMRLGNRAEADADKTKAKDHYDAFQEKCKGLLSDKSCQHIRRMLLKAAWYTANTEKSKQCWLRTERDRYRSDAHSDKSGMYAKYQDIIKTGEISENLATNLKEMGCHVARHATNTLAGHDDDAIRDQANVEAFFKKIQGTVNLVDMKFIMNEAKILSEEPKVVYEEILPNKTDVQQTMEFCFSVTEGKTYSTSHTIGFSYGIESGFSAGFPSVGELSVSLSFNFSHSRSFAESTSTVTTKSYRFPLAVPAHSTYVAKGTVHEALMEIPYELVFDFGGACRSVKGLWKGVACGKATCNIEMIEGPSSPNEPAEESESELEGYCLIL